MKHSECGNCEQIIKSTHRTDEEKKKFSKRLNIIEGQVKGINQMIDDDRYCGDILIQIAAVNKSLQSLGNIILENHLKTCVVNDIKEENLGIIDDVMLLIKKLQ